MGCGLWEIGVTACCEWCGLWPVITMVGAGLWEMELCGLWSGW